MQNLFAFEQCKAAIYQLSVDMVDQRFQPDLNSMLVQDKDFLAQQRKAAKAYFQQMFANPSVPPHDDEQINSAAHEAEERYHSQVKKDFTFFQKDIINQVENLTYIYYSVLGLLPAFADAAKADKKIKHDNFINNRFIKAIGNHPHLTKELLKTDMGWHNKADRVRGWFKDVLKQDDAYMKFLDLRKPDIESEKAVAKHIIRKLILAAGPISDYLEEENIRWSEDRDIIKGLVDRTLKTLNEETGQLELQKVSLDWEDDKQFIETLFHNAASLSKPYRDIIARNTKNWEVDRLPLTDRVILEMAIAELVSFPNIPVKVTINEYIELAKEYSTPNSRQFINGILDVISKELMGTGAIKKSGRGLIDNK
jgi:N utilization substance protein B